MKLAFPRRTRLGLFVLLGVALGGLPVRAAAPFSLGKQFSVEGLIAIRGGHKATFKIIADNGKLRTESNANGKETITLLLPAEGQVYQIVPQQKLVFAVPYVPKAHRVGAPEALSRPFRYVGPDTFDDIACYKFQSPSVNGRSFYLWIDAARRIPLRMRDVDGVFTIILKNYHPGPQDPSLFVVPAGYQKMGMPTLSALDPSVSPRA